MTARFCTFEYDKRAVIDRAYSRELEEEDMNRRRNVVTGLMFLAVIAALSIAQSYFEKMSAQSKGPMVEVPRFEVDPLFPKPLPNKWYQGQTIGLGVDAQDHVWIVHRSDTLSASEGALDNKTGLCCAAAPPVLE